MSSFSLRWEPSGWEQGQWMSLGNWPLRILDPWYVDYEKRRYCLNRHWGLELGRDLDPERVCVSEEHSHLDWGWRITNKQTDGGAQLVPRSGHGKIDFSSCDLITEFVSSVYLFSFPNEAQSLQFLKDAKIQCSF